jgi:hypothetical protein
MHWVLMGLLAWPLVALALGLVIGTAIRLERGADGEPQVRTAPVHDPARVPVAAPDRRPALGAEPLPLNS